MQQIERTQTGLRLEKRLLKVLKGLAEHLEISTAELVEAIALHSFEGKAPFSADLRGKIDLLKAVHDLDLTAADSHGCDEAMPDLLRRFEAAEVDPATFSHADHVRAGYEMLRKHEFFEAAQRFAAALRALTLRAGAPEKFNATVTMGFMSLIAERMDADDPGDADAFLAAHPDLLGGGLMLRYSKGRLRSPLARRAALLPDLAAGAHPLDAGGNSA
jgi:hypothetical protein